MNPLLGLAGVIGVVGVFLIFAEKVDVHLSSGELQEHSPHLSFGQVLPRWLWRIIGTVLVVVAIVLAVRVLLPSRLAIMWGSTSTMDTETMIYRVIGSSDGVPAVGYLLNPKVKSSEPFDFRFVTSQRPRAILVNGNEIFPPDNGMLLFVNNLDGGIDQVVLDEEQASQHFGIKAQLTEDNLKAFWLSMGQAGADREIENTNSPHAEEQDQSR